MSRLGDHFPEHDRQTYVESALQPGQVVYLWCDFTRPPKDKYLLLLCVHSSAPLFFVINSGIADFVQNNPAMHRCQLHLQAAQHGFLAHDSWLNCAEVIDGIRYDEVKNQLMDDTSRLRGRLDAAAIADVVHLVKQAKTISKRHKQMIVQALAD